jgi:hypothetical protein
MNRLIHNFSQFNKRQDPIVFWATAISLFGIAITLGVFVLFYNDLPSQLPLFYSLAWGEGQLVPISQIIILPALTILITLVNLLVSWHLHTSQQVLKRMLSLFSASLSLILTLAAVRIIYLFL